MHSIVEHPVESQKSSFVIKDKNEDMQYLSKYGQQYAKAVSRSRSRENSHSPNISNRSVSPAMAQQRDSAMRNEV